MRSAALFGMAWFFLFLWHSTLLYFYEQENKQFPLADLLLPKPRKGRTVSYLFLVLSLVFIFFLFRASWDLNLNKINDWKVLGITFVFPTIMYVSYLRRRIKCHEGKYVYVFTPIVFSEFRIPIICALLISYFGGYFI